MTAAGIALRRLRARQLLGALAGAVAVLMACASLASAADPYGELARWGGAAAIGDARLGQPAGLAADAVDDSVYVVDTQAWNATPGEATYRLRKFAGATGVVLATRTFTVTASSGALAPSISGVAVDHGARHVYISVVEPRSGDFFLQQVLVFSTEPSGGTLAAPADVADGRLLDSVPTARTNVLVAVDPTNSDVLLSGNDDTFTPIIRRYRGVSAEGGSRLPGEARATGISANFVAPNGLAVEADGRVLVTSQPFLQEWYYAAVERLRADLAESTPLLPTAAQGNIDGGGVIAANDPVTSAGDGRFGPRQIGGPLAVASDGSLLGVTVGLSQIYDGSMADPFVPAGTVREQYGVVRMTPDGEVAGVVGGGAASGTCRNSLVGNISGTAVGATGVQPLSNGKFVVPSWLPDNTAELVVYGPGGSGCPVPSPTLTVRAAGETVAADGVVPIGAEATLELGSSDLRGGALLEIDWDLDGDDANGTQRDGYELKARRPNRFEGAGAPETDTTVRFDAAGSYTIRARIQTTAGTAEVTRVLDVGAGAIPPIASFTGPAVGTVGTPVTFNAGASRAQPNGSTARLRYEWDFGDGTGSATGGVTQAHTYASAGRFTVRLRVTDTSNGRAADATTRQISLTARPGGTTTDTTTPPPPPPPPPTTPTTPLPAPDVTAPVLTFKATTAVPTSGLLTLALGCPAGETSCSGSVEVRTASAVAVSATKRKARAKRSVLTLGRATFTSAGGVTATVKVKLSAAGRKLLARAKKLKVLVTVVTRDAAGNGSTLRKTITLTVAKARARARARGRRK